MNQVQRRQGDIRNPYEDTPINLKWIQERVNLLGKWYLLRRLLLRPLHPKYRQGDWEQAYTNERNSSPVFCLEYRGEIY